MFCLAAVDEVSIRQKETSTTENGKTINDMAKVWSPMPWTQITGASCGCTCTLWHLRSVRVAVWSRNTKVTGWTARCTAQGSAMAQQSRVRQTCVGPGKQTVSFLLLWYSIHHNTVKFILGIRDRIGALGVVDIQGTSMQMEECTKETGKMVRCMAEEPMPDTRSFNW